jgi:hypothetical protein
MTGVATQPISSPLCYGGSLWQSGLPEPGIPQWAPKLLLYSLDDGCIDKHRHCLPSPLGHSLPKKSIEWVLRRRSVFRLSGPRLNRNKVRLVLRAIESIKSQRSQHHPPQCPLRWHQ